MSWKGMIGRTNGMKPTIEASLLKNSITKQKRSDEDAYPFFFLNTIK